MSTIRTSMFIFSFALLLGVASGNAASAEQRQCSHLLFASDFNGNPAGGDKNRLIDAVERGERIRLGWWIDFDADDKADLTHWADAEFLTVLKGEVFAQIDVIQAQRPSRDQPEVRLAEGFVQWQGMLDSTGRLSGSYSDGTPFPELKVRINWCSDRPDDAGWTAVFTNGLNGETLAGDKADLLAAIRAGRPLRVGWGFAAEREGRRHAVEHTAVPDWVSILDETHVVVQLPEHIGQRTYWTMEGALFDDAAVMWRGLMRTDGTFDAVWVHRGTGEVIRRSPQRAVLTWYVEQPPAGSIAPLSISGGVARDDNRAMERIPR